MELQKKRRTLSLIRLILILIAVGLSVASSGLRAFILSYYWGWYRAIVNCIMTASAALLIIITLIIILVERKKQKNFFVVLPLTLIAGGALGASEVFALYYSEICFVSNLLCYVATGFCLASFVLTIVLLTMKKPKENQSVEPDWLRDYHYNENLARATQALDRLKALHEKGYLTETEYCEERMYALYTYRIGKTARFTSTFREYEDKRWRKNVLPNEDPLFPEDIPDKE